MNAEPSAPTQASQALAEIEAGLPGLSERWIPRTQELGSFLERLGEAWNSHDLDALDALTTEDITYQEPALHGATIHGKPQLRAFIETFFDAFPDVNFLGIGTLYLDLEGTGLGLRWKMTGTFTGDLEIWSNQPEADRVRIPPNGRHFEIEGIDLYELRDGKICNYTILYDLLGLSQQLGLLG